MNGRIEVCHCGHDKDTHHQKKHACLGMGCDPECHTFVDRNDLDRPERIQRPTPMLPSDSWDRGKPHMDSDCQCDGCLKWLRSHRYPF